MIDNKEYSSPYDATFYRKDESNKGNNWLKDKTSVTAQFSQNVDDFPALHGEVSIETVSDYVVQKRFAYLSLNCRYKTRVTFLFQT